MSNPLDNTLNSIPPERLEEMRRHTEDELDRLKTSGSIHVEAANRFQQGLDKITDVLLILVMKFGRATTVLLLVGGFNLLLLLALVICTVNILSLRSEVRDIMMRQEEVARSQKRVERATNDTQEAVATTSKQVAQKVDNAVESAPKVEVDSKTGKAKLVVPVEDKKTIKIPLQSSEVPK